MAQPLQIRLGVKADPIEYRYSYGWLLRLMAEEGIEHMQLGSFFEAYQLDDSYFTELRDEAAQHGVRISSVFTAHRELGGFFRCDPRWEAVARRNYERFIEIGALLGAQHVGSNPGATLRDEMDAKGEGVACYLRHMKELMAYAHAQGVQCLTIEPMSCLAEPPTLPDEIAGMAEELLAHHRETPNTSRIGYCADTSHGYAEADGRVVHSHIDLFRATLPYLVEFHVKNTDALFSSTFGFSEEERQHGIVDLAAFRDLLVEHASVLPRNEVVAYLEIGGPKLGRDYSDRELEGQLRASLQHMRETLVVG